MLATHAKEVLNAAQLGLDAQAYDYAQTRGQHFEQDGDGEIVTFDDSSKVRIEINDDHEITFSAA